MREEMTTRLKAALDGAQAAARELNQDFVSTEHLVLGMLSADGSEAVALLAAQIDPKELRQALVKALPRGNEPPIVTGNLPLSPRARRALNEALVHAQNLHEPRISTRMMLLALLEEPDSQIRTALRDCGADLDQFQRVLSERPDAAEA